LIHRNEIKIRITNSFIYQIATGIAYLQKEEGDSWRSEGLECVCQMPPGCFEQFNRYELKNADLGVSKKLVFKEKPDRNYDSDRL